MSEKDTPNNDLKQASDNIKKSVKNVVKKIQFTGRFDITISAKNTEKPVFLKTK